MFVSTLQEILTLLVMVQSGVHRASPQPAHLSLSRGKNLSKRNVTMGKTSNPPRQPREDLRWPSQWPPRLFTLHSADLGGLATVCHFPSAPAGAECHGSRVGGPKATPEAALGLRLENRKNYKKRTSKNLKKIL